MVNGSKKDIGKFKDLNPCLKDLSENPLEGLDDDKLKETLGDPQNLEDYPDETLKDNFYIEEEIDYSE